MSFNTAELTEALEANDYDAIDDLHQVLVDDVENVNALFRTVRDELDTRDWKLVMANRPETCYIQPKNEEEF